VRLSAVLDEREAVPRRQFHHAVHVDRPAGEVDAEHGPGSRRKDGGDGGGGDVLRHVIDIGEDGNGTAQGDARGRGEIAPGGGDHLVARADVEGDQRELEGECAIGKSYGIAPVEGGCGLLLEQPPLVAGPVVDATAPQHGGRLVDLVGREKRPRPSAIRQSYIPPRHAIGSTAPSRKL
jgi:hypothetical protein